MLVPLPEHEKLLEDNREAADELSKEERYLLDLIRVPGLGAHLRCMDVKFNFSARFLTLNTQL